MTIAELKSKLNADGGTMSGIYKITRKADGKVYIGQSICITNRILQHINNVHENDSEKIDGAIQKDGWEAFDYEVLLALPELNAEQLWLAESTNIDKYDSYNTGFNKTKGNHIGKFDSAEHVKFIKKNVVSTELTKMIRNNFKLAFKNKKVLLISLFTEQFIDVLRYNNCEVITISKYVNDSNERAKYIMEELIKMSGKYFDLIIANPPYGFNGANITKQIIDTIDYTDYINLLPANDYKKNTTGDLYKYADLTTMKPVTNGFSDALVTTHMARINKKPCMYISWDEFQIENYTDASLKKYFYTNLNRKHYAIDKNDTWVLITDTITNDTSVLLSHRLLANKHLAYSKNTAEYQWNVAKTLTIAGMHLDNPNSSTPNKTNKNHIDFNTSIEKDNMVTFMYSNTGFKFMTKICTAVNADSTRPLSNILPKVDWTRSWTVEEILADYGYSEAEIAEVMADLNSTDDKGNPKYKYLED